MSETLTAESVAGICEHMNDDHADSVASYALHFAGLRDVVHARMIAMDAHGMDLQVEGAHSTQTARIDFDHEVTGTDDARDTLIAMARTAAGAP